MAGFLSKRWKLLLGMALGGVFLLFFSVSLLIGTQVRDVVAEARQLNPGEPVPALVKMVESPELSLEQRNSAVWALGQLGDPRALPVLEKLHSGGECHHSQQLCQHELDKAIASCRGGLNLGAIIWRHGELASR